MKDFFYYVFYRASRFYEDWGEKNNHYISGKFSLFLAVCANILTLMGLFCFILKIRYSIEVVFGIWILLFILSFFILNKKKYEELKEKYRIEKSSKVRGWLVFMYIIGSVILYFVSLAFMHNN